ncbi:hypothetical protein [Pelagibaculum spongiae]|uniref:hypothetical protein n=1 Tax=Pelagibaculum spongiae TaxID=2080658 RepID=UPI0013142097|nr:hypothetical protein [Pelagibaculum spongiae]
MKGKIVDISSKRNEADLKRKAEKLDQMKDRFKAARAVDKDAPKKKLLSIFTRNKPKR